MKDNPKLLVYILMLSALGINTPLSIVGIISQISEYFNTSIAITGLYVSSFTFTIAACGLFMPIIFSKYERKRTFVFILTVFAIANAIIIFTKNIYVASISRIISAIFYPAFISIALTVCEEIAPEGEEQDYITKILLGISIGSIVGLPITTAIGTVLGYQMAVAWIFLINLVTLILIIIYFPNMEGKSKSYEVPVSSLKSEKFIMGSLGIIMMPIGATIVYSYLPYFLQIVTHVYTYNLSILLFVYGLISISGTWIGGKLIVKNDRVTLIGFQLLCSFVIAAIFFSAEYLIVCILFIFIFGIMDGLGYNLIQYMESSLLPDTPELANGVFLTIVNGGIAIGTAIGGFLVSGYGIMSIFPGGILFLILAFVLLYFVIFRMKIKLKFD